MAQGTKWRNLEHLIFSSQIYRRWSCAFHDNWCHSDWLSCLRLLRPQLEQLQFSRDIAWSFTRLSFYSSNYDFSRARVKKCGTEHDSVFLEKWTVQHTCCVTCLTYLTFRWPCIVIYSHNKSQQDALFLNFILVKNSTCFGQTSCPSSGVFMPYSQQLVFVILGILSVC